MGTKLSIKTIRIGILILLCTYSGQAEAQRDASKPRRVAIEEDRWEDKIVLALTHDFWLNVPDGVEMRVPSIGFNAHFFSDYTFGPDAITSFAWGFGISSTNVRSNAIFEQAVDENGVLGDQILTPFPIDYEYERSRFGTTHLELPIEFRVITKGKRPFKFVAGFKVGYMLSNKWRIIDTEGKRKYFDFENMNKFRYGITTRVGVGKVQLTGFYSLVPLVERGKGTEVVPISVGLAFTFIK